MDHCSDRLDRLPGDRGDRGEARAWWWWWWWWGGRREAKGVHGSSGGRDGRVHRTGVEAVTGFGQASR